MESRRIALMATGLVGLLAGAYPALVLSRVEPLKILRGQLTVGSRPKVLRTVLLVFQFSVAITLIIGTGVIYSQLSYIRHRDIGYRRQQVVTIKDTYWLGDRAWTFANEARKLPGVVNATVSGDLPNQKVVFIGFFKDRSASVTSTALLGVWHVDPDYIPTLGMKLVAGRNFSLQLHTDSACAFQPTAGLFTVFSGLAMIVAALGIFGLVTTATEQRAKELGIRRVLGARLSHLVLLLAKDYGWAIGLAVLIALPVGGWVMHDWLQGYAYRTQLQPYIFITAPLCAIAIAVLIVGVKAARTAATPLADTLRTE